MKAFCLKCYKVLNQVCLYLPPIFYKFQKLEKLKWVYFVVEFLFFLFFSRETTITYVMHISHGLPEKFILIVGGC